MRFFLVLVFFLGCSDPEDVGYDAALVDAPRTDIGPDVSVDGGPVTDGDVQDTPPDATPDAGSDSSDAGMDIPTTDGPTTDVPNVDVPIVDACPPGGFGRECNTDMECPCGAPYCAAVGFFGRPGFCTVRDCTPPEDTVVCPEGFNCVDLSTLVEGHPTVCQPPPDFDGGVPDAGMDAPMDVGMDAPMDVVMDAPMDVGMDVASDPGMCADPDVFLGLGCATAADCGCDADFCTNRGATPGYCTYDNCIDTPGLCPMGWTCFDLAMVTGMPGLPNFCLRP